MTHCDKVLALLSDGLPHSHMEGYRLGVMLHSRVSDLRKRGHWVYVWRVHRRGRGGAYWYQLVDSPLGEVDAGPGGSTQASASPSAEVAATPSRVTLGARGGVA